MEQVTGGESPARQRCCNKSCAKTDGVPLFVEELTKMVMESGLVREEGTECRGAR